MFAEGFLRLLCYREEKKFAITSQQNKQQTNAQVSDPLGCSAARSNSADTQTVSAEEGFNQEVPSSSHDQVLRVTPQAPGLLIPGCSPVISPHPVCIEDCSLLEHYPDLQVVDSGLISQNLLRGPLNPDDFLIQLPVPVLNPQPGTQQDPHSDSVSTIPDQGYLVMGDSVDLPESGLEPMSNSVLNGMLEKQLEEVYMQHLTDNLARCNSHLGNSLLHGLVQLPLPQPGCQSQGIYSLEASLEEDSGGDSKDKISYLSTNNVVPCSSNFSSPVLRISEFDGPHLQGDAIPK